MTHTLARSVRLHRMADGTWKPLDGQDDSLVRDGEAIHVPFMLMDSTRSMPSAPVFDASHARPRQGVRSLEDQARSVASRSKYQDRISDAWKNPVLPPMQQNKQDGRQRTSTAFTPPPDEDADAAYDRMRQRLENRWRNPV